MIFLYTCPYLHVLFWGIGMLWIILLTIFCNKWLITVSKNISKANPLDYITIFYAMPLKHPLFSRLSPDMTLRQESSCEVNDGCARPPRLHTFPFLSNTHSLPASWHVSLQELTATLPRPPLWVRLLVQPHLTSAWPTSMLLISTSSD